MFNNDLTEREYEIKKREKWLNRSKKFEDIKEKVGDIIYDVTNGIKYITRKKTPEEVEHIKREKWLDRSRKIEHFKLKAKEFLTKEKDVEAEPTAKENTPIKDYDLSDFQSLIKEFAVKKDEEENQDKEIKYTLPENDDFDYVGDDDILEEETKTDEKLESILNALNDNEVLDDDLSIITENVKIKEEILNNKEENNKLNINLDKIKETLNNGKEFILKNVIPKEEKVRLRNLRIKKVVIGSLLTLTGSIALSKQSLPIGFANSILIASSLNIGMYTTMNGILKKEEPKPKMKVFKDLDKIGK